jgi:pimeloyl-ACP methyl ester carboxylesterase
MPHQADLYYYAYSPEEKHRLPMVLIHGAGGDHLHWPAQIRRLSGCRVYALDLPGHGKSSGHGLQRIADYGERVLTWMSAVQLSRAVIIGHSMGGAIAQWLGVNHPDRLHGLGLVGTGAHLPVNPVLLAETAHKSTFNRAADRITDWSFSQAADSRVVDLARQRLKEVRPGVLHGDFLACSRYDLRREIGEITAPAVIICGEDDRMTPPAYSEFLARNIPDAQLETIPEAGHMVMIEQPDRTAEILRRFRKELKE